jgi:hypothetical protein
VVLDVGSTALQTSGERFSWTPRLVAVSPPATAAALPECAKWLWLQYFNPGHGEKEKRRLVKVGEKDAWTLLLVVF